MTKYFSEMVLASMALLCTFEQAVLADGLPRDLAYVDTLTHNTAWQSSNLTMKVVPDDFNHFYCLVGLPVSEAINLLADRFKFTNGNSDFIPMAAGPYDKTLLEVQYTENHESILRFRFVEKNGDTIRCGDYSAWQTDDIKPKVRSYDRYYPNLNHLSNMNEKFDKQKWLLGSESGNRFKETWDLLHSHAVIGMTRENLQKLLGPSNDFLDQPDSNKVDKVDYYQLTSPGCEAPPENLYLEFKYSAGRISAFRIEKVIPPPLDEQTAKVLFK